MLETLIYAAAAAGWLGIAYTAGSIYNYLSRQAIKRQRETAARSWTTHSGNMTERAYDALEPWYNPHR